MNVNLALFLLIVFCNHCLESKTINDLSHVKGSKFFNIPKKSLTSSSFNGKIPDRPFCQSIVAYYVGNLQNKKSNKTSNIEFQLRLNVDQEKKRIHINADKWNEDLSQSQNFELDFYYEGSRQWCDIYDDCTSSLAKRETNFRVDLNTANGNYFHLLNFNFFNNSFGLNGPIDKCTQNQLNDLNDEWTPDLDKLKSCVCCDSYKPNVLLGCPCNKWKDEMTTQIQLLPTTKKVIPTKPQPIKDIQCNEIVGYYSGFFRNQHKSKLIHDVEFQILMVTNDIDRRVHFTIDHWNEDKSVSNDFTIYAYNGEKNPDAVNHDPYRGCHPINSECSIQYVTQQRPNFFFFLNYKINGVWQTDYHFLNFPNFNNVFTVTNAIGHCTHNQAQLGGDGMPNATLYDYCVCCGSEYNPDPALGCPKNPWV